MWCNISKVKIKTFHILQNFAFTPLLSPLIFYHTFCFIWSVLPHLQVFFRSMSIEHHKSPNRLIFIFSYTFYPRSCLTLFNLLLSENNLNFKCHIGRVNRECVVRLVQVFPYILFCLTCFSQLYFQRVYKHVSYFI